MKLALLFLNVFIFLSSSSQMFTPPGKMVNVGGHRMHLLIMGKGSPTVIMENGSGDFSFVWSLVQPSVSQFTSTVSYDRAGYAWSEAGPAPRTDKQITWELHEALRKASIRPPYILVGQSFGGFLVRAFARYYPKEVAGMVLVEAVNENARILIGGNPTRIREFAKGRTAPNIQESITQKTTTTFSSSVVQVDTSIEFPMDRLPTKEQQWQKWAQNQPTFRATVDSEMTWSPEDVQRIFKNKGNPSYRLGNIPLIVLTRANGGYKGRTDSTELEQERLSQQKELSLLSTNSKWIIDKNSGHNIHLEDPQLVIRSIHEVVEAVRQHKKLK